MGLSLFEGCTLQNSSVFILKKKTHLTMGLSRSYAKNLPSSERREPFEDDFRPYLSRAGVDLPEHVTFWSTLHLGGKKRAAPTAIFPDPLLRK